MTEFIDGKRVLVSDNVERFTPYAVDDTPKKKYRKSPQKRQSQLVVMIDPTLKANETVAETEAKATVTIETGAKTEVLCKKTHIFFETKECKHYLQECNACGEKQFCADHGCLNCSLEKDENTPALSVMNDEERKIMRTIRQRPKAKRPAPKKRRIRRKDANYYRDAWLDDLIAQR